MKKLSILIIAVACSTASAQDCESIIVFAKKSTLTVADSGAFDQEAANFCNAYSRGVSSTSDTNFGASYKFLSASFGQDNASTETIASKVCSASNRSQANQYAYRQYVDEIAPGAFNAYQACVNAKDSLQFKVDIASLLPEEFSISAHFRPGVPRATAQLKHTESQGISCQWDGTSRNGIVLTGGESTSLHCRRKDRTQQGYVKVINSAGPEALTIPWKRYDKDGNAIDTIAALSANLAALKSTVLALEANSAKNQTQTANNTNGIAELFKGTQLIMQPTNQCPPGWVFVTNLFLGVDPTTTVAVGNAGIQPGGGGPGLAMVGPWPGYHPGLCKRT
ncbi:hypothetical protein RugamoR64_07750 [Duganella rhizosphaerae]|uniref:hypothetical protein n=1 Tax=Duganella rhizosphaerae TaxID=2885763 RepID=UPI0030EA7158